MGKGDRRWPDRETRRENVEKGILDDSMDEIPIYDLEEWGISGEERPTTTPAERPKPRPRPRRSA